MRIEDRIAVNANYFDTDGKPIENLHVLSMIDLRYNGAFSFNPQGFTCSKSGKNVLLLFTKDKKLYSLDENEYAKKQVSESGSYDFTMSNITNSVTNSSDLKKYLGLK